ncbi:MAG: DUF418 domain-containing protein [Bacteroidota bacterium]|nr:DUF418 domain-containing protein [Bacteroidota bacterium]
MNQVKSCGRIISLDVLRGIAVLGILIMNIQSFSMPAAAYLNPTVYGDMTGWNKWVWILSHLLAHGRFLTIFSILFGAGIILFTTRADAKGKNSRALHYRRMGWLLLFGLMHRYLLWMGDILFAYSLCGMLVFLFRKLPPVKLLWISFILYMVPVITYLFAGLCLPILPEGYVEIAKSSWDPAPQAIQDQIEVFRGPWIEQVNYRFRESVFMQVKHLFLQRFWRVSALMLLGMALQKWEFLSATHSNTLYRRLAVIGISSGLILTSLDMVFDFRTHWDMEFSRFIGSRLNYIGSQAMGLGYIGIVMLICKKSSFQRFKNLFASVGKMAFTNYILMSFIATFVFYGSGFGLFGKVERLGQMGFVLGIWILIVLVSYVWLKLFRYGPIEALWRKLTYGRQKVFISGV